MIEAKLFDLDWLEDDANLIASVAATSLALSLQDELKRGARTGNKYPDLPYVSSARGEPEQEQSGELRESVKVKPVDYVPYLSNASAIGFFDVEKEKLYRLEADVSDPAYRGTLNRLANDVNERAVWLTEIKDALLTDV